MRGKAAQSVQLPDNLGIIPAHAGKSPVTAEMDFERNNHPRSCGEKVLVPLCIGQTDGSSPLMRGKGRAIFCMRGRARIIPAHAGKRSSHSISGWLTRDHPRSCGEKLLLVSHITPNTGSSPLVRGKALDERVAERGDGSIPAHAGKSAFNASYSDGV